MESIIVAKALVQNPQGQFLVIRRSNTAPRRPLQWDFPGGFVDKTDSSYKSACLREVTEETGLVADDKKTELFYTNSQLKESDGEMKNVSWLYFKCLVASDHVKLSHEHDKAAWIYTNELLEYIIYDAQIRAIKYLIELKKES